MNSPKSLLPSSPQRRRFLQTSVLGGMTAALLPALAGARELATSTRAPDVKPFELDEMTIADLQAGMSSGKFTARSITEKYLTRIDAIDKQGPAINSVLELNSDALAMADAADKERRDKGARGPLHGIPVLIKDNIDTADRMETTAGSLAMLGSRCTKDAFVVQKLREDRWRCLDRAVQKMLSLFKSCARLEQLFSAKPI